jgi:hypothetical protein
MTIKSIIKEKIREIDIAHIWHTQPARFYARDLDCMIIQVAERFVNEVKSPIFVGEARDYCQIIILIASCVFIKNTHDHVRNGIAICIMDTTGEFNFHGV